MVHTRRNADAAKLLLGAVLGVLVTDRHGAYNWWPDRLRQFCWAHLKRQFQTMSERGGDSARIGKALLEEVGRLFHFWHRVRDGTLKRSSFQVYMRALRGRVEALLAEGATISHAKTNKTCRKLLKHTESLWTFARVKGVQPTNNAAEQIIRHGVIMRKLSHGTHCEKGSRFIERILTVHATLRLQKRNVLDFVRQACEAALRGTTPPSLLPVNVAARPDIAA
jgi:transposase